MKSGISFTAALRACLALLLFAFTAFAANAAQLRVLIDTDNNPATGCTVTLPDGTHTFTGAEIVLSTDINIAVFPHTVTSVTQQTCATAPSTLSAPSAVSAGGWNVGTGGGVNGYDVIETFLPVNSPVGNYRLGFVYTNPATGSDVLVSTNDTFNGPPIVFALAGPAGANGIPTLSDAGLLILTLLFCVGAWFALRRYKTSAMFALAVLAFVVTSSTWAIVLDGLITDWAGVSPLASDSIGDAAPGSDISAVFAKLEGSNLYFRADVLSTGAPVVNSTTPTAGATNVPDSSTVVFNFNMPVNVSGTSFTFTCNGTPKAFSVSGSGTAVITLTPTTPLPALQVCTPTALAAQIANSQGTHLGADSSFSFTVGKNSQTISFTSAAPVGVAVGGPTYNVTATASSGLPVAFSIDASAASVCSIAGSTVSFIGGGTCVINANQAGNGSYSAAPQVQQSFALAKGNQTLSFTSTAPAGAVVGGASYIAAATATSGLAATFSIDASASAVCSLAGSTVSFIGVGTCVINANQAGNANYNPAPQVQQSFAVGKGSQTLSFTSVAPVSAALGGSTYSVTATATSGLTVAFTVDASASAVCSIAGSTVSFIGLGTCVLNANQAGNANYNAAPQVQQSFAVGKGGQTISFTSTAPVGATVGGATYSVAATASSGLTVAFTIDASASTVCSIAGSTVSFIGIGSCVINANQPGNVSYNAATQVQQSFTVAKGAQTISYTSAAPVAAVVGGASYTVTATASSGLTVAFTIDASASAVCSIAGSTVSFIGVGSCVINANQPGNVNYNAASQVQQTFTVAKGAQTISYTSAAPVAAAVGGASYTVTATASSGLTVAFTIDASASAVCSIAGSTVSFIGVGSCVINANQPGNVNYNAASQVQQTFTVAKGAQTISYTSTAPVSAAVGGATYNVTATASSGLAVVLSIDASAASVCSIAGSTVSFSGVGTCLINANQSGNANYNAAPQAQQSFAVAKGSQTISYTSVAPVSATVGGATYNVSATASSGLTVTFTIDASAAAVCSIAGSTVSMTGGGTCVINANQAGNATYNAATQVQQSFVIAKGNQTISYTSTAPAGATVGGATYSVAATATSGLTVVYTVDATASAVCSIAGSTVSFIGVGSCVINANQAGNSAYNAAPQVQQSFAVAKGGQTISFTSAAPAAVVGGASYNVSATASSGLSVTFTIDASASAVCSIAGSTVSFNTVGTCVINANQPGNSNYNAASQAQQSFAVGKGNQTVSFSSTAPLAATVAGATYSVVASATSGLGVSLTIDASAASVCSIAGTTVSFIGGGTCVINANQAGDANYNAASQAQQSFSVVKTGQTISFTSTAPVAAAAGGATYGVSATATSGLAVNFSIDASAASVCSIAGSTVSFLTAGTCVVNANQPGNSAYNAAPQVQQSFSVFGTQTISYTSTAPTAAMYQGSTYSVAATATSGLTVSFAIDASAASVCSIAGTTVSFTGLGSCVINANQAGNSSYLAAPQMQQSFSVGPKLVGDSYSVVGNTQLVAAAHSAPATPFTTDVNALLANDTAGASAITVTTASNAATTGGGLITIDSAGAFTYTPPVGVSSGSDTYVYTGTADGISRTATITFNISGIVWFVKNDSVGSHDGRSNSPFLNMGAGVNNLGSALANAGPAAGASIYVYKGSGSTTGAYALKTNQRLIGAGATLTVGALTIAGNALNTPTLSGTLSASAATGLTVDGLSLSTGASTAVSLINSDGSFNFTSISANGASNGIVWDNSSGSAATGSFTVNGDGSNTAVGGNASGGTIANMSGADNATAGSGIYLSKVANVTLRRMTINGTNQNYGIRGKQVNGFTLEYSTVSGTNGTAASFVAPENYGEGSVYFGNATTSGLSGTAIFTNNVISGGRARNLSIVNTAAGTTTLTVKGNTFGALQNFSDANSSLAVEARVNSGVVINSTVGGTLAGEGNSFSSAVGDLLNFTGQSNTTMDVVLKNNTLTDNHASNIVGGGGITLSSLGTMTFNVDGNTQRDADGSAITLQKGDPSPSAATTYSGKLNNNAIGLAGTTDSGSKSGNGVFASYAGSGSASATISNNTIHQYNGNGGIYADNTGGSYTANFTITSNVVSARPNPGGNAFAGLALTNGAPASADTVSVCADVKSNNFSIGDPNNANDIIVGSSGTNGGHSFNLPGYAGGANLGNVQTFLSGNNAFAGTVATAYVDAPATAAAFTGSGSTCPTP